jgi:hypothetical protein
MALIIKAPNEVLSLANIKNTKLFLAGGITKVRDWQYDVCKTLSDCNNLTIYNPRRENFNMESSLQMEEQIVWEYNHLKDCDWLIFWFSHETLQPITLYELGKWGSSYAATMNAKRIWVGIDPEYPRLKDVVIQTKLAAPHRDIYNSLHDLIKDVKHLAKRL